MKAFPVFDAHCDTALELWERQASLRQNSGQWDLARAAQLPGWAQFFAFCPICSPFAAELGAEAVLARAYAQFLQQLEACQLPVCRESGGRRGHRMRPGPPGAFAAAGLYHDGTDLEL